MIFISIQMCYLYLLINVWFSCVGSVLFRVFVVFHQPSRTCLVLSASLFLINGFRASSLKSNFEPSNPRYVSFFLSSDVFFLRHHNLGLRTRIVYVCYVLSSMCQKGLNQDVLLSEIFDRFLSNWRVSLNCSLRMRLRMPWQSHIRTWMKRLILSPSLGWVFVFYFYFTHWEVEAWFQPN